LIQIRRWVDDAKHKRPHSTLDVQVDPSRLIGVDSQVYIQHDTLYASLCYNIYLIMHTHRIYSLCNNGVPLLVI